jgi:hypothetical protein
MTPERIQSLRDGLVLAMRHVRRGQVPQTYLARCGDLDEDDHKCITRDAPDLARGWRQLAIDIKAMRSKKTQDRETWGKER